MPLEIVAGVDRQGRIVIRRAVTIVDAEELGGAMTEKLAELFDENAEPPEPTKRARPPRRGGKAA